MKFRPRAAITGGRSIPRTPAVMEKARKDVTLLKTSVDRIQQAFRARGDSVNLNDLAALAGKMLALIDPTASAVTTRRSTLPVRGAERPGTARAETLAGACGCRTEVHFGCRSGARRDCGLLQPVGALQPDPAACAPGASTHWKVVPRGHHHLDALPSRQGRVSDRAPIKCSSLLRWKLSGLSEPAPAGSADAAGQPAPPQPRYQLQSRAQALALLDMVQRYFRHAEPSSPIPMLCERARRAWRNETSWGS